MFNKIISTYGALQLKQLKGTPRLTLLEQLLEEARSPILQHTDQQLLYTNTLRQVSDFAYDRLRSRFVLRGDIDAVRQALSGPNMYGCLDLDAGVAAAADIDAYLATLASPYSHIFEVGLSRNNVADGDLGRYLPLLAKSTMPIIRLDLEHNDLTQASMPALRAFLASELCFIEDLNIRANAYTAVDYDVCLESLLTTRPQLYALAISGYHSFEARHTLYAGYLLAETQLAALAVSVYSGNERAEKRFQQDLRAAACNVYSFEGFELSAALTRQLTSRRERSAVLLYSDRARYYHQATHAKMFARYFE